MDPGTTILHRPRSTASNGSIYIEPSLCPLELTNGLGPATLRGTSVWNRHSSGPSRNARLDTLRWTGEAASKIVRVCPEREWSRWISCCQRANGGRTGERRANDRHRPEELEQLIASFAAGTSKSQLAMWYGISVS